MFLLRCKTAFRLGVVNVLRVVLYRVQLRVGWFKRILPIGKPVVGPFYCVELSGASNPEILSTIKYFGWKAVDFSGMPVWLRDPFLGFVHTSSVRHWSEIVDFEAPQTDIKVIWELSRFHWLLDMARKYVHKNDISILAGMDCMLEDWSKHNPCNQGPNWKCAQEASVRVLHMMHVARLCGMLDRPGPGLLKMIEQHCNRIVPTTHYAIAQDNNHGTSEAAALFVGGEWLSRLSGGSHAKAGLWASKGRAMLEERVARLIFADGSFSQHSVNYHRVMLDTLSFVDSMRQFWRLSPFSADFYLRAMAATNWLFAFVSADSGDAPNMGANDGAHLFASSDYAYRDFRASVQAAAGLFLQGRVYSASPQDYLANELNAPVVCRRRSMDQTVAFPVGGYAILRSADMRIQLVLRLPVYDFRPSHADALHLDLWYAGTNILRDGGTYSYNGTEDTIAYYAGAMSHSTAQFDKRDQMPKLSRFLFGGWLTEAETTRYGSQAGNTVKAAYRDMWGAYHRRCVELQGGQVVVHDHVDGFCSEAVIRWRLFCDAWTYDTANSRVSCPLCRISWRSDQDVSCRLVDGFESRYYLQQERVVVLEITLNKPGVLITVIELK